MTNFFASDKSIYRLSFSDNYFYRRLILIDEYSYDIFFYKREHLVFCNLKIPLVYLFYFKFDQNFLKLNKIMSGSS